MTLEQINNDIDVLDHKYKSLLMDKEYHEKQLRDTRALILRTQRSLAELENKKINHIRLFAHANLKKQQS